MSSLSIKRSYSTKKEQGSNNRGEQTVYVHKQLLMLHLPTFILLTKFLLHFKVDMTSVGKKKKNGNLVISCQLLMETKPQIAGNMCEDFI